MNDRSRVLTAACVGAALGGLWGWLYLTPNGGLVRDQINPALDRIASTLDRVQSFLETTDRPAKSA